LETAVAVHGEAGLGDFNIPDYTPSSVDSRPAYQYIIDTIKANPNEITIVAVAALTNLALALKAAPEIASLVKEVVIMGGAFGENGHYGNVTPYAEANIHYDPHAAEIVFNAPWSIVVIGLDVTKEVVYTADYFDKLRDNSGVVGDFIWDISQYYMRFYAKELGFKGCHMHDASAIGYIINPKLFTLREGVVSVKCSGKKIGQTTQQAINPQNKQIDWKQINFQTNIAINIDSTTLLDLFYNSIVNYSEA
jgi:inosine-uridine nucleoside N-ribohydrolase